jgi:hypothetical protein
MNYDIGDMTVTYCGKILNLLMLVMPHTCSHTCICCILHFIHLLYLHVLSYCPQSNTGYDGAFNNVMVVIAV